MITGLLSGNNVVNGSFSAVQKKLNAVNVAKRLDYWTVDVLAMMPLMSRPMHHVTNIVKQAVTQ